jgi:hypothetical protein
MSHNIESIQGETPNVSSEVTGTLSNSQTLGYMLNYSTGQTRSTSGNYGANDYYDFWTGADNYSGLGTLGGNYVTLPRGHFFVLCAPTFGDKTSSSGNNEARMQWVKHDGTPANDEAIGNLSSVNLDYVEPTYPSTGKCAAYVEGPCEIRLKFISIPAGTFPKAGTETNKSPFFLYIQRIA